MAAFAVARVLSLLNGSARRPATVALTAAAATSSRTGTSSLLRSAGSSRMAPALRRLGALHGAAVICSAAGEGLLEVQLKVDGMVCEGCSGRVQETLEKMAGVKKVHVDLEKGLATVAVEAGAAPDALAAAQPLADAVRELGFDAAPQVAGA